MLPAIKRMHQKKSPPASTGGLRTCARQACSRHALSLYMKVKSKESLLFVSVWEWSERVDWGRNGTATALHARRFGRRRVLCRHVSEGDLQGGRCLFCDVNAHLIRYPNLLQIQFLPCFSGQNVTEHARYKVEGARRTCVAATCPTCCICRPDTDPSVITLH